MSDVISSLAKTFVWFSMISTLEVVSKPRYFGIKLVTKASHTLLNILLKYQSLFTLNNVLKILVGSLVLCLISKEATAVLPEAFLCIKPFVLENSELNSVRLRP